MGRPLRIDNAGDYHHVINRGRNKQDVFRDDGDRHFFMEPLRTAVERGYVEVHSFTLLDNHYHLLLRSLLKGGTSRTMQLLGAYTLEFNRKYGYDGSLFKGRYYSKRVDSEGYLMEIPRYIANNPVKAGLVLKPSDYPWSSHATLLGTTDAVDFPIALGLVDEFFNGDVSALDRFVRAGDNPKSVRLEQVIDANLTEQSLEASLEQLALGLAKLDELPLRPGSLHGLLQTLTAFVCESLQVRRVAIAFPQDETDRLAKALLLTLLHRCELAHMADLAFAFGYGSKQTTVRAVKHFEALAAHDPELAALLQAGMSFAELAA